MNSNLIRRIAREISRFIIDNSNMGQNFKATTGYTLSSVAETARW